MYKILDILATHDIGKTVYRLEKYVDSEIGKIEGFTIIDVRMLNERSFEISFFGLALV
jgi:hypothetical protein